MNIILLEESDILPDSRWAMLRGRRFEHMTQVQHASVGDSFRVGMVDGAMGTGTVIRVESDTLELDLDLKDDPPRPLPVTLVLALPRPKMLRRVLASATSLGVKRMVLVNAARVEKSYWQTPFLSETSLRETLCLGLEQAVDTRLPDVQLRPRFKPFVEDELPALSDGTVAVVAHPGVSTPCPSNVQESVTLVVGPEGGFVPYEIELLEQQGVRACHFGPRVLRVETAVPALLAHLFGHALSGG